MKIVKSDNFVYKETKTKMKDFSSYTFHTRMLSSGIFESTLTTNGFRSTVILDYFAIIKKIFAYL